MLSNFVGKVIDFMSKHESVYSVCEKEFFARKELQTNRIESVLIFNFLMSNCELASKI